MYLFAARWMPINMSYSLWAAGENKSKYLECYKLASARLRRISHWAPGKFVELVVSLSIYWNQWGFHVNLCLLVRKSNINDFKVHVTDTRLILKKQFLVTLKFFSLLLQNNKRSNCWENVSTTAFSLCERCQALDKTEEIQTMFAGCTSTNKLKRS